MTRNESVDWLLLQARQKKNASQEQKQRYYDEYKVLLGEICVGDDDYARKLYQESLEELGRVLGV